jgi:hypothetical protein
MSVRWLKNGSFGFACVSACAVGAKPNVPFVRLAKIVFKKVRRGKNKKHRVGNECRLTRCPIVVSFLCRWSPVKMVYFLCLIVCLSMVVVSSAALAPNGSGLGAVREIGEFTLHFLSVSNLAKIPQEP